jgi:hypothetical protein
MLVVLDPPYQPFSDCETLMVGFGGSLQSDHIHNQYGSLRGRRRQIHGQDNAHPLSHTRIGTTKAMFGILTGTLVSTKLPSLDDGMS